MGLGWWLFGSGGVVLIETSDDGKKVNDSGGGLECNGSRRATGEVKSQKRKRNENGGDDETRQGEGEPRGRCASEIICRGGGGRSGGHLTSPSQSRWSVVFSPFMGSSLSSSPVVPLPASTSTPVSGSALFSSGPVSRSVVQDSTACRPGDGRREVRRVDCRDMKRSVSAGGCLAESGMHHFILGVVHARGLAEKGIGEL